MSFKGFPERALLFYEGLEADNSKAYWTDSKDVYDRCVAEPFRELLTELEPTFGPGKLFRPYRDVRFSKDKTPYKTQAAAAVGGGFYVALSADGLFVGGGMYAMASDQVQRLRAAVADDLTGRQLTDLLAVLRGQAWQVGGDRLVRVPKPWDVEHPRAELLRHKSLVASQAWEPAPWLHTREALDRLAAAWRQLGPLLEWLELRVGPTRSADASSRS